MSCWACNFGDDCCDGVRADVRDILKQAENTTDPVESLAHHRLAAMQFYRMCPRCIVRTAGLFQGALLDGTEREA